ncbi:MAG TPA: molybdenum cofactor guanylyltransferase [Desulfatiglandales bacterium]|nr:molybdenum cofactor guanylyltransferase [Desulfatiglandales bacterium]
METTGVILAGGKSRRMGEDKRFLKVGEETLLKRSLRVMSRIFSEVFVVIAQDSPPLELPGCQVYRDLIPDCGSLGGLYTGLARATRGRIFAVACDMPFLNQDLIQWFLARDSEADVVMARLESGLQPLHAVYGKRTLPYLQRMAEARQLKIQTIVSQPLLRVTIVQPSEWQSLDPQSRSFQNVNSPEELQAARIAVTQIPLSE